MKTFSHNLGKHYGGKKTYNSCPYCRNKCEYLPIVNGLKKLIVGVHFSTIQEFSDENGFTKNKNTQCKFILTRGKNKGNECAKKSLILLAITGLFPFVETAIFKSPTE